jgi:hypothetical protein
MYERVSSRLYRRYGNTWKALTEITVSFSIRFAAQCSLRRPIAELEGGSLGNTKHCAMYTLPRPIAELELKVCRTLRRPIAELKFGDL